MCKVEAVSQNNQFHDLLFSDFSKPNISDQKMQDSQDVQVIKLDVVSIFC